ncbi:Na+/H+ antiporter subunit E [Croceibacterium ferulae]|uniref:Na+/H+ antiporter subunit E n=1 Tax=Croceibacterium ferulae TaxID=1854641 RepID=UPI000EAB90B1|nr:Na+/H+ antiporter subunit E [Croceibacterium ferulae]
MTRLVPHPLLTTCLLVMWLLLTQSVSPGQILLGGIVALIAGKTMALLRPDPVEIRSWRAVLRLTGIVAVDILRSNLAVGRIVALPSRRRRVSGFIRLPLAITNPYALTTLAIILTATPGTLWLQYNRTTGSLLLHVLDLVDEEEWIRLIKHRYERLLLEIFA